MRVTLTRIARELFCPAPYDFPEEHGRTRFLKSLGVNHPMFRSSTRGTVFDASARAQELLVSQEIIRGEQQVEGIEKVLGAAASTYVAGAVSSVGSFLYIACIVYSMVRRNE